MWNAEGLGQRSAVSPAARSASHGGAPQQSTALEGYAQIARETSLPNPAAAAAVQCRPVAGVLRPEGAGASFSPGGPGAPGGAAAPTFAPAPAGGLQPQAPAGAVVRPYSTASAAAQAGAASAPPSRPAAAASARAAGASGARRVGSGLGDDRVQRLDLDSLLRHVGASGASDLHLTSGAPPMVRQSGGLSPLAEHEPLSAEVLQETLYQILTQRQRETFEEHLELDFSYQVHSGPRFRVNYYRQRENIGAAFRVIPSEIKALEELGVPPVVATFAALPRGLVLVTGPTGSGKSTTLAGVIDLANRTRADHIMSVEDPIEFLHHHKKAIVNQREVGSDTHSFAAALKHVLRQDPDIILIGELRDQETISTALTAAETGHLVFATLHTQDAAQTIDRIIDVFPAHQQAQVRTQLSGSLQAVVCQTLCKRADGPGRVVATEVMVATPGVRNLIREGKTHQIHSQMQAGREHGMHSMDQHLADLARQGRISYEVGLDKCHSPEEFNRLMGRASGGRGSITGAPNQYGFQEG